MQSPKQCRFCRHYISAVKFFLLVELPFHAGTSLRWDDDAIGVGYMVCRTDNAVKNRYMAICKKTEREKSKGTPRRSSAGTSASARCATLTPSDSDAFTTPARSTGGELP
eukprot:1716878-Pyramimonas_sp.AAC.2